MRRRLPEEADQRRLGRERSVGRRREKNRVAALPPAGHAAHVGDEPDAADDRRRRDRGAVGVVVERDVAGDDRDPERLRGLRDPLDRLRQLVRDLRLLGIAEVEAVGEPDRLAAGARDVARGAERRLDAGAEAVGLARRGALQRDREPAQRRPQAQDGRVETRPAHSARADEVVVLLDHLAHVELRRLGLPHRPRLRPLLDLVARALVGQQPRGDLADDLARRGTRAARRSRSPRRSPCTAAPSARTRRAPRRASPAGRPRPSAPATPRS